jgi:thiol-disulfide isomerase/thioredoxin
VSFVRSRRTRSAAAAALLVLLAGPAVTACSALDGTTNKSTATGAGVVTIIEPADREAPVEFTGTTLDGDELDIADYRGKAVVLNIWGSWCGPCHLEMPHLLEAQELLAGTDTVFLGINVRDSPDDAAAFERQYGVTWPSIDDQGGRTLLALRGVVPPTQTPSTLVLDPEGRVAARVLGVVPTAITLKDLVEPVAPSVAASPSASTPVDEDEDEDAARG